MTIRAHVLKEAGYAILGDRDKRYGKPENNFRRIADLWNAYLKGLPDYTSHTIPRVDEADVALMLDLVKTARLQNDKKNVDSWVDKAGYSACGAEVAGIQLGEAPDVDRGLGK